MKLQEIVAHNIPGFRACALQDREHYTDYYDVIEKYAAEFTENSELQILLGDEWAQELLLAHSESRRAERDIDEYVYYLWSQSALYHCNALVNRLVGRYLCSMRTTITNQRYEIRVNGRTLVVFQEIKSPGKSVVARMLRAPMITTNAHAVRVLPPITQLMDIYRALYSPSEADNWQTLQARETAIFEFLRRQQNNTATRITGAGPGAGPEIHANVRKLQQQIIAETDGVLVGEYALQALGVSRGTFVPSMIASVAEAQRVAHKFELKYSTQSMSVLSDFRLQRTTLEAKNNKIMYMYNSSEYDLIPVKHAVRKNSLALGAPAVILRSLLLEIWIILWISSINKINADFANQRIDKLLADFIKYRENISAIVPTAKSKFRGVYVSDTLAAKHILATQRKHHPEYWPQRYWREHETFRELSI